MGIKFRAWDKRNNKWFHPDLIILTNAGFYEDFREFDDGNSLFDYEYELVLFTGLKDKKGTGIYNLDIVESSAQINGYPKGNKFLVQWNEDECYYDLLSLSGYLIAKLTKNKCKSLTVVGNKFENPEMIGEED